MNCLHYKQPNFWINTNIRKLIKLFTGHSTWFHGEMFNLLRAFHCQSVRVSAVFTGAAIRPIFVTSFVKVFLAYFKAKLKYICTIPYLLENCIAYKSSLYQFSWNGNSLVLFWYSELIFVVYCFLNNNNYQFMFGSF